MAKVALIYLPPGGGATKQGVDDFLASGNSTDDLLKLASSELLEVKAKEADDGDKTQAQRLV